MQNVVAILVVVLIGGVLPLQTYAAHESACLNNEAYRKVIEENGVSAPRSCHWIRFHESRRLVQCLDPDVAENCKQTCGICCDDDPTYTFLLRKTSAPTRVSCEWITRNYKKTEIRREEYCEIHSYENDVNIRSGCARSCEYCFEAYSAAPSITTMPSKSPTELPSPSPTEVPTASPSESPTNVPSRSPTPVPTSDPTPTPSQKPSSKPSMAPSPHPSPHPSPAPSPHPSPSPTESPTAPPTIAGSSKPSSSPTMYPSHLPTNQPSTYPSESPSDWQCKDDPNFIFRMDSNQYPVNCAWLGLANPQRRFDKYCHRAEIKSACMETCKYCECMDNWDYKFPLKRGSKKKHCSWLTRNKKWTDVRRAKYCYSDATLGLGTDIADECTLSCGFCTPR